MKFFRALMLLMLGFAVLSGTALCNTQDTPIAQAPSCHAPAPDSQVQLFGEHVPNCAALDPLPFPPSSGKHYQVWARYQIYNQPVSTGYWLHSAEHGAVIILYKCPQGCHDAVLTLQAFVESLPEDPLCTSLNAKPPVKRRIILAPSPLLDSTFAAVAWGWSLKTNCLDTAALRSFYNSHYGKSYEDFCDDGVDLSATHWCGESSVRPNPSPRSISRERMDKVLWEGSLMKRTTMTLEISALDGARLETVSLGEMGPGAAKAIWDADSYRQSLKARSTRKTGSASGALIVRVVASSAKTHRTLAEKIVLP